MGQRPSIQEQMFNSVRSISATLAILFITVFFGFAPIALAKPFLIGVSLPLSGNVSKLADQFLAGMRFAIERQGKSEEFDLLAVDDGCDREIGHVAAEDLANSDSVLVTGYFCSDTAAIAAEVLKDKSIPIIVNIARSERLLKDRQKEQWNLWREAPGDDYPAEAAFNTLSKRWKNTPYAVVDDGTIYGRSLVDEFRVRMEGADIPPLYADNFRASQSTQAGLIRRLQRSGVKAAFIGASSDDLALIVRNISELGAKFEIAGGEVMNVLPYLLNSEPVPAGLLAIMEPETDNLPSLKELTNEMLARDIQPEPYFFEGYAAMELAMATLQNGADRISETLISAEFQTILGPVKFDEAGKNIHNRFSLYQWDGTQFVDAEASPPGN